MKKFAFLSLSLFSLHSWGFNFSTCDNQSLTLMIQPMNDPRSTSLGINTNIEILQKDGGVTMPVLAFESVSGNLTTYVGKIGSFSLVINRPPNQQKDFIGNAVIGSQKMNFICN